LNENSNDNRSNFLSAKSAAQNRMSQQVTAKSATQNAQQFHGMDKNDKKKLLIQGPRWNSSATRAQQLLDYTAAACCIQRFNDLSSSHLSPFGCNKVTTSFKEVFAIPV
jgi:hypothetical protein